MKEVTLDPDLKLALRVWWAFTWRSGIFMVVGALALSALSAALFALPARILPLFARKPLAVCFTILIFGVVFYAQVAVFRIILRMDFGDFRVRVTAPPASTAPE